MGSSAPPLPPPTQASTFCISCGHFCVLQRIRSCLLLRRVNVRRAPWSMIACLSHARGLACGTRQIHGNMQELNDAQAILVDESGLGISPENLGIITAYHHISFKTAHTCFEHLNAKSKMKSLLQVVSHATEFDALPIRPGDDVAISRILKHAKYAVQSIFADARSKANALLQAHFGRTLLRGDLVSDQEVVLETAVRLLHAIVDILSSKSHLAACLLAMEMCQMVVQGMHVKDPLLMQIPGVSRSLAEKCEREGALPAGLP
jgi:pre-mRNA-splicing helicase BRR2